MNVSLMRLTLMSATHLIYIDVFTCNHSYHHHTLLSPATATMVTHGKQTNTHTKQQETTTTTKNTKLWKKLMTNSQKESREKKKRILYLLFTQTHEAAYSFSPVPSLVLSHSFVFVFLHYNR